MRGLLLDTHVALWWLDERPLQPAAQEAITNPYRDVIISVASLWELAIKHSVGRFRYDGDLAAVLRAQGFQLLHVTEVHVRAVRDLPLHHRDPFDRMLVAQAQVERLALVTRDRKLTAYDVEVMTA